MSSCLIVCFCLFRLLLDRTTVQQHRPLPDPYTHKHNQGTYKVLLNGDGVDNPGEDPNKLLAVYCVPCGIGEFCNGKSEGELIFAVLLLLCAVCLLLAIVPALLSKMKLSGESALMIMPNTPPTLTHNNNNKNKTNKNSKTRPRLLPRRHDRLDDWHQGGGRLPKLPRRHVQRPAGPVRVPGVRALCVCVCVLVEAWRRALSRYCAAAADATNAA